MFPGPHAVRGTAGRSEAGLVGRSRSVRRATGHPFYGRQPTPRYAANRGRARAGPRRTARRVPRPGGLPAGRGRPAGRAGLRRADRVRAARRRRVVRPDHRRQGRAGGDGGRGVPPLRAAARPAGRAGRLAGGGDGAVHRRPWRRSTSAPRRPTGSRGWSRRTSATASPRTSTARCRPTSTPRPATWCWTCSRTPGTRSSRSTGCGRRSRRTRGSPGRLALWGRRLVGEALSQAQRVAAERDALAALLVGGIVAPAAPTWPRSAGCSPGSPRTTPAGWPALRPRPPERTGPAAAHMRRSRPGGSRARRSRRRRACPRGRDLPAALVGQREHGGVAGHGGGDRRRGSRPWSRRCRSPARGWRAGRRS